MILAPEASHADHLLHRGPGDERHRHVDPADPDHQLVAVMRDDGSSEGCGLRRSRGGRRSWSLRGRLVLSEGETRRRQDQPGQGDGIRKMSQDHGTLSEAGFAGESLRDP